MALWAVTPMAVAAGKTAIDYVNVQVALGVSSAITTYNSLNPTAKEVIKAAGNIAYGYLADEDPNNPRNMYQLIGVVTKNIYNNREAIIDVTRMVLRTISKNISENIRYSHYK